MADKESALREYTLKGIGETGYICEKCVCLLDMKKQFDARWYNKTELEQLNSIPENERCNHLKD